MYHWMSYVTGELVENLPSVVYEISRTMKCSGGWGFLDKLKYTVCWRYSRKGF